MTLQANEQKTMNTNLV